MELRAATFNLKHGARPGAIALPWRSLGRLRASVRALDADVIGLQEVDRFVARSWFGDQARTCARSAGASAHRFAAARWLLGGRYGNALVVRGEVRSSETVALPRPARSEARVALIADIVVRETALTAVSTHLHNDEAVAAEQLVALLAVLATRPRPLLLLGDLNLGRDDFAPVLAADHFDVGPETPSFPWRDPLVQIDVVAVAGGSITGASAPMVATSDHRPIVATVRI